MDKRKWFLTALSIPIAFLGILPVFARTAVYSVPRQAITPSGDEVLANGQILTGTGILGEADRLSTEYGSRPPYVGPKFAPGQRLSPEQAMYALPFVIACESAKSPDGKNISKKVLDSNGYYSYGIAQIQSSTWAGFVKESGLGGDPMVKEDAVRMSLWAFENGYLYKWSCAKIEKIIRS